RRYICAPTKSRPPTRAIRRRPHGVSPTSRIEGTSNTILNSSSVLISGMTFPPLAELHEARSGSQSIDDDGKRQGPGAAWMAMHNSENLRSLQQVSHSGAV